MFDERDNKDKFNYDKTVPSVVTSPLICSYGGLTLTVSDTGGRFYGSRHFLPELVYACSDKSGNSSHTGVVQSM